MGAKLRAFLNSIHSLGADKGENRDGSEDHPNDTDTHGAQQDPAVVDVHFPEHVAPDGRHAGVREVRDGEYDTFHDRAFPILQTQGHVSIFLVHTVDLSRTINKTTTLNRSNQSNNQSKNQTNQTNHTIKPIKQSIEESNQSNKSNKSKQSNNQSKNQKQENKMK